jgi:hypothetical protein
MTLGTTYSLGWARSGDGPIRQHAENANGLGNVFDALLTQILVTQRKLRSDLTVNHVRNANAPRLGQALQSRGDIDTIAVNLLALDHHIAEVDADAELHPTVEGQLRILGLKLGLDCNGARNRLDHTGELGQYAVAGRVHESAMVSFDQGVSDLAVS